jgi:hypothetical protein
MAIIAIKTRGVAHNTPSSRVRFVARWCVWSPVETAGGVFQVRDDEPEPRVATVLHRTP